jgi:hypothetical protein
MVKSLKLFLSLIFLSSCSENTLTQDQKIELAEKKWQVIDYYQKHIDKVSQDFGEDWVEPNAFLNLGVAYLKNQQYELAKEQLTKSLKYYNGQSAEPNIIGLYMKIIKDIRTKP